MDKIAAYTIALQELESEKRAEHIIENLNQVLNEGGVLEFSHV
jgi:hypothetical protein